MPSELCRKLKAALIIAILAGAEVRQDDRFSFPPFSKPASKATSTQVFRDLAPVFAKEMERIEANPRLQQHAKSLAKHIDAMATDPVVQERAQAVEQQMKAVLDDQYLQDFTKRATKDRDEEKQLNDHFAEHIQRLAKQVGMVMLDPHVQEHTQHIAQQVEAMLIDTSLQKHARRIAAQIETMSANRSSAKHLNSLVQEGEAREVSIRGTLLLNKARRSPQGRRLRAEPSKDRPSNRFVYNDVDTLIDRALKSSPRFNAPLEGTAEGKAGHLDRRLGPEKVGLEEEALGLKNGLEEDAIPDEEDVDYHHDHVGWNPLASIGLKDESFAFASAAALSCVFLVYGAVSLLAEPLLARFVFAPTMPAHQLLTFTNPLYQDDKGFRCARRLVLLGLTRREADFNRRSIASVLLGGFVGGMRHSKNRPAGVRTMSLVSLGACLYTICSCFAFEDGSQLWDSSRISAQLPSGIGFLGGAVIFKHSLKNLGDKPEIVGLTTACSIWLACSVGLCCGGGMYFTGLLGTAAMAVSLHFGDKKIISSKYGKAKNKHCRDNDILPT